MLQRSSKLSRSNYSARSLRLEPLEDRSLLSVTLQDLSVALLNDTGASATDLVTYDSQLTYGDSQLADTTVEFSFDNGTTWASDYTTKLTEGLNAFKVRQKNLDGDTSLGTDFSFTLDSVAPVAQTATPNVEFVTDSTGQLTITVAYDEAMDTTVNPTITFDPTVAYTSLIFNSGSWSDDGKTYTATYDVPPYTDYSSGVEADNIDISVSDGKDVAGNVQASATFTDEFDVDTLGPTVTITLADGQSDVTSDATIHFTVTFSEDVENFTADCVGLYSYAGDLSVEVTGNGATYDVTVTGMTHSGNIYAYIDQGVIVDADGNGNESSDSVSILYSTTSLLTAGDGFVFDVLNAYANSITTDAEGNIYVAGTVDGKADFDPSSQINIILDDNDGTAFIAKYTSAGALLWVKSFATTATESSYSYSTASKILIDAAGNIYLAGDLRGSMTVEVGDSTVTLTSTSSSYYSSNAFLLKLDASGNAVWAKSFSGDPEYGDYHYSNNSSIEGLALDGSGNLYITGTFSGKVDFDPTDTEAFLTSSGYNDAYVLKLDAAGALVWVKMAGAATAEEGKEDSTADSGCNGVGVVVVEGYIYIAGSYHGTIDFDPAAETEALFTSVGSTEAFLWKLDANGNFAWAGSTIGTSTTDEESGTTTTSECYAYNIVADASGNIYLSGEYRGTVLFNPNDATQTLTASSQSAYVLKFNADNSFGWVRTTTGNSEEYYGTSARSLTIDADSNVYVTGYFYGPVDFDPDADNAVTLSTQSTSGYVWKLDTNGDFLWAVAPTTQSSESVDETAAYSCCYTYDVAVDALGGVYVVGYMYGYNDSDVNFNSGEGDLIVPAGNSAAFVWNIDSMAFETTLSNNSIAEKEAVGALIGQFTTAEKEAGSVTYALVAGNGDTDNALFTIDGDKLLANAIFNADKQDAYTIRVRTTDADGYASETVYAITIIDVGPTISAVIIAVDQNVATWNVASDAKLVSTVLTIDGQATTLYGPYAAEVGDNYAGVFASLSEGSHTFVITATDADGNVSTYSDSLVVAQGGPAIGSVIVVAEQGVITWNAKDADGIASATITVDGKKVTVCGPYGSEFDANFAGVFTAFTSGTHAFVITVTDVDGNVSTYQDSFKVADAMPTIGSVIVVAEQGLITWNAADASGIASTTLTIDDQKVSVYGPYGTKFDANYAAVFTPYTADGTYEFVIKATDVNGNVTEYQGSFTIDTTAAVPVIALVEDTGSSDTDGITTNGELSLTGIEDGAKVEYSIDDGETWTDGFTAVEGENSVLVRQTDVAGNMSEAGSLTFTLDTTAAAPVVALLEDTGSSDSDGITSKGELSLTGVEDGATAEYSIDDGTTWANSFAAVAGENSVLVRQTDAAGNVSETASLAFRLDTTAPEAPALALAEDTGSSDTDGITSNGAVLLTGDEDGATVEYSIDGGTNWASSLNLNEGDNAVLVRQTDVAGNVSATGSLAFTLYTYGPTVLINKASGQEDPTGDTTVNYTVAFNRAVTGFDASDIDLSASTAAGTLTAAVEPIGTDGAWYSVSVSGMTGAGDVIASVLADAAIDLAGNPSVGSSSEDNTIAYDPDLEVEAMDAVFAEYC